MGTGCQRVTGVHEKDTDVVVGQWKDGRLGTVRGIRAGKSEYGTLVFAEHGVQQVRLDARYIYRELLKAIVTMFQTGKPPIAPAISLEIVAFIEAAQKSAHNHGITMEVSP